MTAAEIEQLFETLLVGAVGGTATNWRKALGPVEALPIVFHPRSNWSIAPKGTRAQLDAIGKAEAIIRAEHPYVSSPRSQ